MANEIKPIASTDFTAMDAVVGNLMSDLRQIIDEARMHVASTANYELTMMYWHIGERINRDVLRNERAEYGKQIVATVSRQLQNIYGHKGFDVMGHRDLSLCPFFLRNFAHQKTDKHNGMVVESKAYTLPFNLKISVTRFFLACSII